MLIESILVRHFVDSNLRVEIFFEKDGAVENGGVDFEIGDISTSAYLYWRLKKISYSACLRFYCFSDDKKKLLKALLTRTFILPLLSSELWKRYTLRLLLMCLEALKEGFSFFPGRYWEWVSRNLLSLVKLYQRIWKSNLDQSLIMALQIVVVCTVLF